MPTPPNETIELRAQQVDRTGAIHAMRLKTAEVV
jgi:hypothetical protein